MKLLGTGNPKTLKGEKYGYLTHILHLAPSDRSGFNVCPMASTGCRAACLNTAGRGRFDKTQNARVRKTRLFFEDRKTFMAQLVRDIEKGICRAKKLNMIPVFRLNGTSDIRWENIPVNGYRNVMTLFAGIQFYDYTKLTNRRYVPNNYHLTFSRSEDTSITNMEIAWSEGMNIAVVFGVNKKDPLPSHWLGYPVYDADEHDLRFLDPPNHISGLRAKGEAKYDLTGFVVKV